MPVHCLLLIREKSERFGYHCCLIKRMKIINTTMVALLLCGSAWAGDRSFYISNLNNPNDITYVQRQGNVYYVSESGAQQSKATRSRLQAESDAIQARIDRLLAE